jgi:hypothetical protein
VSFKKLTLENWTRPDRTNEAFARLSPVDGFRRMSGDDWEPEFPSIELGSHVPQNIQNRPIGERRREFPKVFSRTLVAGKLGCLRVPSLDGVTQLLVLGVVELELLAPQSAELVEHVGEDIREESAILLRRESAEAI